MDDDPIRIAAADAKCREFVRVINLICDAGLEPAGPLTPDLVFDPDGNAWPIPPSRMTVGDILDYVECRFGPLFVGFCKSRSEFTVQ